MTPDELRMIFATTTSLSYNLPGYIAQWVLYGMSIAILVWALFIFGMNGRSSTGASLATLFITIVCGTMASLLLAAGAGTVAIYLDLSFLLAREPTNLGTRRWPFDDRSFFKINCITNWVGSLAPIFSDIIVVWRASLLYPGQQWLMILPITLILGTVATTLAYDIPTSSYHTWYQTVVAPSSMTATLSLGQASVWLSIASNAVATALVGYKYWMYKQNIQPHLNGSQGNRPVGRTLTLIVESGVLFCIVQLALSVTQTVYIHTATLTRSLYIGTSVFSNFVEFLAIIYPVLVLAVVRSRNSVMDNDASFRLPTLVGENNDARN